MFNKNKSKRQKPQPKRLQQPDISPINTVKINALSQMYENLPKSGFSKLVVTFCLFFSVLVIVVSFVFLWLGMDSSSLLVPALGFFGSELLVLGATNIFSKEKTKDDLIFDQLRHDLNDGAYYDCNGKVVYREKVDEIQFQEDFQKEVVLDSDSNDFNDYNENIFMDDIDYNRELSFSSDVCSMDAGTVDYTADCTMDAEEGPKPIVHKSSTLTSSALSTSTTPKKRGRPKKEKAPIIEEKKECYGEADSDERD